MEMELAFSDLGLIDKRITRINEGLKAAKPSERETGIKEIAILEGIKASLEKSIPIRQQNLSDDVIKAIRHYQFLTSKPLLVLVNIGEDQIPQAKQIGKRSCHSYRRSRQQLIAKARPTIGRQRIAAGHV